jgi:Caspase domain
MGTRSTAVGQGLAQQGGGVGTLIAFATQPGNVALDGKGRNSPFTTALLKHLGTPGQDIMRDMVMVRRDVISSTNGAQVPWDNSSLTGDVVLNSGSAAPIVTLPEDNTVETAFWNSILNEKDANFFEQYLTRFPKGKFVDLAKLKLVVAKRSAAPLPTVVKSAPETKVASLDQGFTEPTAEHPFDGYWEITRTAARNGKESSCGWPFLVDNIEIKNSTFNTTEWKGTLDKKGNLKGFHYFAAGGDQYTKPGDNVEAGRNRLTASMNVDLGTGRFTQVGGGCRGTLKLVRQ